jgi:hypothetical protein
MEKEAMAIATPSPANDAALNAQLDITRDASIANIRTQSEETRQQYRDEAARIESQKQRSAEVVQSNVNATLDNRAIAAEANFQQAIKNAEAVENAVFQHLDAPPDGSPKVINYNRLNGVPLNLHADIVRTGQEVLKARDVYLETHPEARDNPAFQARIGEDGLVKYGPELQEQTAIASPDELRAMPLDELRRTVQRPNQRQANPNEPLVKFIDQPDGTFDAQLITGETFRGFKANENRDAIRKIAESKVNTRRHYENLVQQQQPGQQPTNGQQPQQQPANGQHTDPGLTANQPFDSQAYLREETAKAFGFKDAEEMISDYGFMREQAEKYRILELSSSFHSRNQDFPNTDQAVEALEAVCRANNWDMENIDNLSNAHAVAVRHRLYEPLTQEQIRASVAGSEPAHRPTPPPMPRGGNPESSTPAQSVYEMPMDQLRKLALGAQTGGR